MRLPNFAKPRIGPNRMFVLDVQNGNEELDVGQASSQEIGPMPLKSSSSSRHRISSAGIRRLPGTPDRINGKSSLLSG